MKIILAALNAKYIHSNLAVYDLEAYAKEQQKKRSATQQKGRERAVQAELVVKEYTINHNLDLILQSLYQEKAKVAAFSCYIWNIQEVLMIARELYKVAPGIRIWLGGPEVSYDSQKLLAKHPYIEGIMQGEGEVTFYRLVEIWEEAEFALENPAGTGFDIDAHYRETLGITYRGRQGAIQQNLPGPLMDLNDLPFVYKDLSQFENKILYYETSRGCPFSCSYCLSSIDKQVRFRDFSLVQKELDFFLGHKVSQVKFIDRTFNCKKEHALKIWNYIMEHDNGITNFHFEIAADLIGEEELAVFRKMRPGLIQLEIGLQSANIATIKEIHRVMDVDKVKNTLLAIHGFQNIHQHLDLIAGLPYEDFTTFKKSFNAAYEMKPDQLQLGFLKVLKGSYMEEQVKNYELQYKDFQPYEVLSTKWITYDEILALKRVEEMVEVYYNSDQFEHVLPYLISFFQSPYAFYEALGNYYEEHDLAGIGFRRESRYGTLRAFSVLSLNDREMFSVEVFDSLLTFDYYLRENAKSRPAWAKTEPIEKEVYHAFFKNGGTEEICLKREGYDSRTAARIMHIEPVVGEAMPWLTGENTDGRQKIYCLFDYEQRNPLSKDAKVKFLSHLHTVKENKEYEIKND